MSEVFRGDTGVGALLPLPEDWLPVDFLAFAFSLAVWPCSVR